jgi:hypothetical protein
VTVADAVPIVGFERQLMLCDVTASVSVAGSLMEIVLEAGQPFASVTEMV